MRPEAQGVEIWEELCLVGICFFWQLFHFFLRIVARDLVEGEIEKRIAIVRIERKNCWT
jgi:hypothetical protein